MDHLLAIVRSLKGSKFIDYVDAFLTMHPQEGDQRRNICRMAAYCSKSLMVILHHVSIAARRL